MPATDRGRASRRAASAGRRMVSIAGVVLVAGLALPLLAAPTPNLGYGHARGTSGLATAANGSVRLTVGLTDAPSFAPGSLTVVAGSAVTFALDNVGAYNHTFSLSGAANVTLNRSWTPAQLDRFFSRNGTSVNATVAPGTSANVTFPVPVSWAGESFEFASLVPYQFQAGMFGFLNVTSGVASTGFVIVVETAPSALAFDPAAIEIDATSFPVQVEAKVSNQGSTPHTWTLAAQPNVNLTTGGFSAYFQQHPPAANVAVPTTPSVVVTANFTLGARGIYEYICEVAGHFTNGMFGYLYVGVPAPPTTAAPSTAIVQGWVLVGAGSLLGLGVLLAAVASLAGRLPPRAPPSHP